MQVLQVTPCNVCLYFGNIVPKRTNERIRFDPSSSRETMLAMVLTFFVFFIPRMPRIVSKYLSPSKGNIGNIHRQHVDQCDSEKYQRHPG